MNISRHKSDERVADVRITDDTLSVTVRDGRTIIVPLNWYPRLLNASQDAKKNWEIAGAGYGIHWPDLDEDLSTEGLLRGAPDTKLGNRGTRVHSDTPPLFIFLPREYYDRNFEVSNAIEDLPLLTESFVS